MFILLLLMIFPLLTIYAEEDVDLLIPETQAEIDRWLEFGKPRGFEEIPRKERIPPKRPYRLSIKNVISSTLENQWNIQIAEREVWRQDGLLQASRGPFDPNIGIGYRHNWLIDAQTFGLKTGMDGNLDSMQVFLEKLTRIGTRYSLSGEVEREFNPSFSLDNSFNRTNKTVITFLVEHPLLRRFRYNTESVNERVEGLELSAVRNELTQTMAENVRNVLNVYWDLVAAKKVVTINENAKKILEGLASATELLVDGDRVAKSELNQQFAELARNNRELIAAEQDVFRIYNDLFFLMGIDREEFPLETPDLQLDHFLLFNVKKSDWCVDHLLDISQQNRGDLLASQIRIEEAQWRLRLAEQEIYPSLDLQAGVDLFNSQINNRAKPFFSSTNGRKAQKDYRIGINFSIPLFNNQAKGEKRRREEEKAQASLSEEQLSETIETQVSTAYREQLQLIDEIYYARKSAKWYKKALRDEVLRFKEGHGSLFVIIDFENRLRLTLIQEVSVLARWAKNIVELLFQTGTLIERDLRTCEMRVDVENYEKLLKKP